MSVAPEDTVDTDPDFVTTPDGRTVDPEKVDAGVVVPTEQDEDQLPHPALSKRE